MSRRRILVVLLGLTALFVAAGAQAQTASPSRSPTSDPEGSPLVIGCDTTAYDEYFCSNNSDISCTSAADCGGAACVLQPVFVKNECTITKFFQQFVILAQWGVSFVILLGVLMIIWGGIQWITAAGRSSKIEEGKRIILGTLVGITVSFTAYIIVNFVVAAITGTTTPSANPFAGPIATIFQNQSIDGESIERPFSSDSQGGVENVSNCRANWNHDCSTDQIYCSDPGLTAGRITQIQNKLNTKSCSCGTSDGCFGSNTATCVRRWQIANSLEPTGMIDAPTQAIIDNDSQFTASQNCISSPLASQIPTVINSIPRPTTAGLASVGETIGCCVVKNGGHPLFCSDHMSQRTCASLGSDNTFKAGANCTLDIDTRDSCGFCYNNNQCFGLTGQYWCTGVVNPAISWHDGPAIGSLQCPGSTSYTETLRATF